MLFIRIRLVLTQLENELLFNCHRNIAPNNQFYPNKHINSYTKGKLEIYDL